MRLKAPDHIAIGVGATMVSLSALLFLYFFFLSRTTNVPKTDKEREEGALLLVKLSHEYRMIAAERLAAIKLFHGALDHSSPEYLRMKRICLALSAARRAGNQKIQEIHTQYPQPTKKQVLEEMRPFVKQFEDAIRGEHLEKSIYFPAVLEHIDKVVQLVKGD